MQKYYFGFPQKQKNCENHKQTGGLILFFQYPVLCSTLLHLPPLRFHCVGGCWDTTQESCDFGFAVRRSNLSDSSHPPLG
jgi:hypothetical protein